MPTLTKQLSPDVFSMGWERTFNRQEIEATLGPVGPLALLRFISVRSSWCHDTNEDTRNACVQGAEIYLKKINELGYNAFLFRSSADLSDENIVKIQRKPLNVEPELYGFNIYEFKQKSYSSTLGTKFCGLMKVNIKKIKILYKYINTKNNVVVILSKKDNLVCDIKIDFIFKIGFPFFYKGISSGLNRYLLSFALCREGDIVIFDSGYFDDRERELGFLFDPSLPDNAFLLK